MLGCQGVLAIDISSKAFQNFLVLVAFVNKK